MKIKILMEIRNLNMLLSLNANLGTFFLLVQLDLKGISGILVSKFSLNIGLKLMINSISN